jgi:hypothetical protein
LFCLDGESKDGDRREKEEAGKKVTRGIRDRDGEATKSKRRRNRKDRQIKLGP